VLSSLLLSVGCQAPFREARMSGGMKKGDKDERKKKRAKKQNEK
jgi:hypothetical protein